MPDTPRVETAVTAEIDPADAIRRMRKGAILLDVRDDDERASGMPKQALGISLLALEQDIGALVESRCAELLTICATGRRSLLARDQLLELGYSNVLSVRGGFSRWCEEGLPTEAGTMDADSAERYSRHLLLPEVGVSGQLKLGSARVAMVGAGGLGSPAALYLAAAGVGHLTLIDDDRVERSNLQRQVIHADARVGMAKTASAGITLAGLNPALQLELREERLRAGNVEALLAGHDLIIDGADNFPTRYLLDAASRNLNIPLVYGAVHRFTGQVSVFDPRRDDSPCYRCLFPEPPSAEEAPNCSEAGVLGVLPGIIGLLQCSEAIKLIIGMGRPLVGRLLCFDALNASFRELTLARDPRCPGCSRGEGRVAYEDIEGFCSTI
ncbi:molybdopterin-synthase adenylyltransferase MoeB [Dokdonella sp.]|uniref:molybdopterin-synthase adenylyltransferase MoeB n=1 Tax=Dokdonella sp. TaxID=2291710 RepID=UPI003528EC0E